jgi:tripartite-type tricarboxylate transporter receptor subunit TctC
MNRLHLTLRLLPLLAAVLPAITVPAQAQNYPTRTVRMIVPFPPGGISDTLARITAQQFSEILSQQFVVDNRPGAGTTLAADLISKAAPDGHTLYFTDVTTHAINASLYSRLPFDPVRDFSAIALMAQTPLVLVVHPSMPVKSVPEFIALAKAKPDAVIYASSGNGTIIHLAMEAIRAQAGIKMVHVPFKGSAPAANAVLAGEVAASFTTTPAALPYTSSGRLRAIGVSGAKRSEAFPAVPAIAESLKGYDIILYSGLLGPAGMAPEIVAKLNTTTLSMLKQPKVVEQWARYGAQPVGMTPAQVTEHIKSEIAKFSKIVKASGAKID